MASINGKAVPLSRDHKPTLKDERARIEAAGGFVEYKRVNGNLALSRALGDFMFKRNDHKSAQEQIVTGKYEVILFHNKVSLILIIVINIVMDYHTLFSRMCLSFFLR